MDLREMKTRRSITNAFLAIRSKKPLERITVRELCEQAEISKATFYLHYHDIYDLSDALQMQTIRDILDNLKSTSDLIDDPCVASKELIDGFYANRGMVNILFSGSQFAKLPEKIEAELKKILFRDFPSLQENAYVNIRITYQLMGAFYAFYQYENTFGFDEVFAAVNKITAMFAPQKNNPAQQS